MPDLDLESLKRSIDLADYARSRGYQDKPREGIPGVTVLEHEGLGDRIAVARLAQGGIYARIADYQPRTPEESDEQARHRLRDAIARSKDTGGVVEFVQKLERTAGRPEPSAQQVREHLRAWHDVQRGPERDGMAATDGRHSELQRTGSTTSPEAPNKSLAAGEVTQGGAARPSPAPNRRMGDWSPSPGATTPGESEVQERLRRWAQAQHVIDRRLARSTELSRPPHGASTARDVSEGVNVAPSRDEPSRGPNARPSPIATQRSLGQRRYDWTPPVGNGAKALGPSLPGREPDRGR